MPTTEQASNIVLIVLDTHRLDRIGCYGYHRNTTPNLDAFARTSTRFENAIAPAQWTIPAHASLFSGEPPSTHLTVQAGDMLDPRFKTLAQRLRARGYRTMAFCNNPLVGVLNNGFKRGFQTFYNYSGAFPSTPARVRRRLTTPLAKLWEQYTQLVRKVSYPIQNIFANSTRIFMAALNPFWVPLWTRIARWKGDTARSLRDAAQFIDRQATTDESQPNFVFINLMEPHLPYLPPDRFIRTFAPHLSQERAARDFMRAFNRQAVQWITPLTHPLTALQARTISDMYDAEVAYQDHLLAELFESLERAARRANTATIVVADHGEMLGEHQLMGHGFGVYQELIHVPLLIRCPGQKTPHVIANPVSTTQLFHTILDLAGVEVYETDYSPAMDVQSQSLLGEMRSPGKPPPVVVSEAYAPEFALTSMAKHKPHLIDQLDCRATNRAIYEHIYKLIQFEGVGEAIFDLERDIREQHPLAIHLQAKRRKRLTAQLESFVEKAASRRPTGKRCQTLNLDDEIVQQRLRGLGYVE